MGYLHSIALAYCCERVDVSNGLVYKFCLAFGNDTIYLQRKCCALMAVVLRYDFYFETKTSVFPHCVTCFKVLLKMLG